MAHITGGGILENLPRCLPDYLGANVIRESWISPPVFDWIQKEGNITDPEMMRTFNCGVGMILVLDASDVESALTFLEDEGIFGWRLGSVTEEGPGVRLS